MVRYRRNFVAGGTFFFTVTLADRRSRMLTEHVAHLRSAFREADANAPSPSMPSQSFRSICTL
jgi:putative transposase